MGTLHWHTLGDILTLNLVVFNKITLFLHILQYRLHECLSKLRDKNVDSGNKKGYGAILVINEVVITKLS